MTANAASSLDTNSLVAANEELLDFAQSSALAEELRKLRFVWDTGELNAESASYALLERHGLAEDGQLNRIGTLFLGRLLFHFDVSKNGGEALGSLSEKYENFRVLSVGKNSIVVAADHIILGTKFVLKLLRPGASTKLPESLKRLSALDSKSAIVRPIDYQRVTVVDVLGNPATLDCLVFPYVEGLTLREFLHQKNHHLNSQVALAFARQVGSALAELENIGAYHGDLHERNIIVDEFAAEGLRFRIVDISFDAMGSLSFEVCRNNDLEQFKRHIWRLLSAQRAFLPNLSIRKYIGTKTYLTITRILSNQTASFEDVCKALRDDSEYLQYLSERMRFVSDRFQAPSSFRLQRYEEITDPTIAVSLFVPFEELMNKVSSFSNVFVSGNRGSGKSTYLAALAFFPESETAAVDVREVFGVYFPCRQGEFRPLKKRPFWTPEIGTTLTTNLVLTKIIRRTLEIIAAGIRTRKLANPTEIHGLREIIAKFVPNAGIVSVAKDIQSEVENLAATMIRVEMQQVAELSRPPTRTEPLEVGTLLTFFGLIRSTFQELSETRFHVLFDDAGAPFIPENVQRVINDLILSSNALYCVKLSAEKYTYSFVSSDGKVLENGQDYFEHDISQILFIGSGSVGLRRTELEHYFRRIVEQRLSHFGYASNNITDYLGDQQVPINELMNLLARGRKDAYYCGWTTVWNIADRTPRNLLEIVSEIFVSGQIERDTEPRVVVRRDQDRAIRTISEKRLESLSQIPGAIQIGGLEVSLGRSLFDVTVTIGSTFRVYLRSQVGVMRKSQHLALERNDLDELSPPAAEVLRKLVTFGILDSGKSDFARDDGVMKPFYILNRIYCPAFGIGYRRDEHLRLSRKRLEMLLLTPALFMREGTRRLREHNTAGGADLFGYHDL